ncbi:chromatin remodeling complex Adenosinetriphosphatase, partial [Exophiala xenobiotica]
RTPVEIGRRCTTLLNTVLREFGDPEEKLTNGHGPGKGRGRDRDEDEDEDNDSEAPPVKKKAKNGIVNKQVKAVKSGRGSKNTSPATSRAQSVSSTAPANRSKGRKK